LFIVSDFACVEDDDPDVLAFAPVDDFVPLEDFDLELVPDDDFPGLAGFDFDSLDVSWPKACGAPKASARRSRLHKRRNDTRLRRRRSWEYSGCKDESIEVNR
jgi:hypothetical protein